VCSSALRQVASTCDKRADILVLVAWLLTNFLDDGQQRSPSGARRKKIVLDGAEYWLVRRAEVTMALTESGSSDDSLTGFGFTSWASSSMRCVQDDDAGREAARRSRRARIHGLLLLAAPQLKRCCDLRTHVFEKPAAQQMALTLTP
jgi:hypothetical protein